MSIDEHRIVIGRILLKSTTKNSSRAQNGEECCQTVVCSTESHPVGTL